MRAVTCIALLAGSFSLSAADKIKLTSDTELEGQIVQDKAGEDYVVIQTADFVYGVKRKDIRELKYDLDVRKEYAKMRDEYCAGDITIGVRGVPGNAAKTQATNLYLLSKWAIEKKLYASAVLDLKEATLVYPELAEAKAEYAKRSKFGEWRDPCIPFPTIKKDDPVETVSKPSMIDMDTLIAEATPKEAVKRRSHFSTIKDTSASLAQNKNSSDAGAKEKAALALFQKEKVKSGEALAACLDSKTVPEKDTRIGALRGIELLKPVGANISYALGTSAVADPEETVRATATKLVKDRNDTAAMNQMIGHLYSAYQPNGEVLSQSLRDSAVASLRNLNDRRIYQGILYRVWMELRLTNISEGNLATRQIDTFGVNNNGQNAVLVPLALPIQFPELSIQRVNTAVIAPATSALRDVTGQDFGQDWDAWSKWVQKQ